MEKTVAAVGFCCADIYQELDKFYPTGNGVDWGVHLARMGVPVSVVSGRCPARGSTSPICAPSRATPVR